jgi:sulfonate transport system permease protein
MSFNTASSIVSRGTIAIFKRSLPWLFPIALILIWQLASSTGILQSRLTCANGGD